jgi:hypothetical protein
MLTQVHSFLNLRWNEIEDSGSGFPQKRISDSFLVLDFLSTISQPSLTKDHFTTNVTYLCRMSFPAISTIISKPLFGYSSCICYETDQFYFCNIAKRAHYIPLASASQDSRASPFSSSAFLIFQGLRGISMCETPT